MTIRHLSTFGRPALVALLVWAGALGATVRAQAPSPAANALTQHPSLYKVDSVEFRLAPGEGMEYKYRMEKGASMVYTWTATGTVDYDMHSEADGAPKGTADSFDMGTADRGHGSYTAPFSGIHGWFWENKGQSEVRVRLASAGFYSSAQEFRKNLRQPYVLKDVQP